MQFSLLPPPFGHIRAVNNSISSSRPPSTLRIGALLILAGLLPPSFAASSQASATYTPLTNFSCTASSFTGAGNDTCTITLNREQRETRTIAIASSSSVVTVPADVYVRREATSVSFTATASAVSAATTVTLTATLGEKSKTFSLQLKPTTSPALTLSTTSATFGTVALNSTTTKTVTLTASGTAALAISKISIAGTGFADAGITVPLTLNPGQTATLAISFDPASAGSFTGSVTIASNAATATVSLTGTGQSAAPTFSANLLQHCLAHRRSYRYLHRLPQRTGNRCNPSNPGQQQQLINRPRFCNHCLGSVKRQLYGNRRRGHFGANSNPHSNLGRNLEERCPHSQRHHPLPDPQQHQCSFRDGGPQHHHDQNRHPDLLRNRRSRHQ